MELNGGNYIELNDGLPHDDCDYFAVYSTVNPFSVEALAEHEIIPAFWDQTI